jgi:hypothetical protein
LVIGRRSLAKSGSQSLVVSAESDLRIPRKELEWAQDKLLNGRGHEERSAEIAESR